MERKRGKDVDVEVDYHGHTAEEMVLALQRKLTAWRGMRRVRVIHGQGEILKEALHRWCQEAGIAFYLEPNNPGSTLLTPNQRTLPQAHLPNTLAESGLRLTPEQEAELRDPEAAKRARLEAQRKRAEAERLRLQEVAARRAQQQRDETLWRQEMARLDAIDKSSGGKKKAADGNKPIPPKIIPPSVLKHQEGYWRSELVRVADTDTETLQKQKRTGLDKLAPPMEPKPKTEPMPEKAKPAAPQRSTAEDQALFEAEMQRLMEG